MRDQRRRHRLDDRRHRAGAADDVDHEIEGLDITERQGFSVTYYRYRASVVSNWEPLGTSAHALISPA
jgi:hypothetical protein